MIIVKLIFLMDEFWRSMGGGFLEQGRFRVNNRICFLGFYIIVLIDLIRLDKDTVEYPVDQNLLTKRYTEKAIDFIERNQDQPFFLHLCHAMPHKPLAASERFYTPDTPNDLYTDVIKELDWSVGEIMSTLEKLDILENTIVIFMSDNGPSYGGSTGGFKGKKATTWEGGIRVPFMIRYPAVFPQNQKVHVPCWSLDLFPTLLSLCGVVLTKTNTIEGEDITAILKGNKTEHAPVYSMHAR